MRPILRHPFVEEVLPVDAPQPGHRRRHAHTPRRADVAQLRKDLAACDGGTGVYAKAKAANGGKDPVFRSGNSAIRTGGSTDSVHGVITIDPGFSRQENATTGIVELTNLSNKARFNTINADVAAGRLSREEYTRANELVEYDAVTNANKAAQACANQWGAPPGWKTTLDAFSKAQNFDDYYNNYLDASHKAYYQKFWDKHFAAIYRAAHP